MRSFRTLDRRAGYSLSAFSLLLAMLAPGLVPAFASAATLSERSITLSSAAKGADLVTYDINFKPTATAGAFVIQFCDSPVIGTACDPVAGLSAAAAETATSGATLVPVDAQGFSVTKAMTGGTPVDVVVTKMHNPTNAGAFYARIVSYDNATHAGDYDAEDLGDGVVDQGSVAMSATDAIGVSVAVLESMTFCVASAAISDNCVGASSNLPNVVLGDPTTGLSSTATSDGNLYTQISTNAAGGAVINLKSNTPGCGGLLRAGAANGTCDIKPAVTAASLTSGGGVALFGLKTGTATGTSGELRAASGYSSSDYHLDYNVANDNSSGITSTYGSPLLDTHDAPANNMNMPITFGASMANDTPAGTYSADLSMIATGKY